MSDTRECPFCGRLLLDPASRGGAPETAGTPRAEHLDPEVLLLVLANNPWWRPEAGLCAPCGAGFASAFAEARGHHPGFARGGVPILPTPVRLFAPEAHAGRGITIAFLDSGFHAHPDLVQPRDRILRYVDVNASRARRADLDRPDESSWHGMMTSVVACGNGWLSGGLYRGLASESRLVLVKVGTARRIKHHDIRRGIEWVIRNRKRYDVRIVNVSCGGDYEASYLVDGLSQAAEAATRAGLLVVAAAGNLGDKPGHPVLPPASAPSVLTVGGLDDKNRLPFSHYDMYHSSYGPTVDGLQKPDVIAPGIWVAAPILPGTPTAAQAELLARLAASSDAELGAALAESRGVDPDLDAALHLEPPLVRQLVAAKVRDNNVVSGAYKHVDGTSFAAPIVSSLAAQVLEVNPALAPRDVKRLLLQTARRLPHVEVDRQGWGVVDARRALEAARRGRP
ncbi:MAG TPA: S8 family serine peptidase, partial [Vicinamibacteria bacterium]|nr:S8 family serine peptidase [Vicinamibacteria bacterium]